MPNRIATVLAGAVALSMATAGIVAADSVDGDADIVISGTQSLINLGTVAGGSTHTLDFGFDLVCKGTSHVPVGTTIDLTPAPTAPAGGTIDATPASVGPVPDSWPGAGEACIGDPVLPATVRSHVTIVAPLAAGSNYIYRVAFTRSPSGGTSGTTMAQVALSVAANAAPELDLPADMNVEGNATGGWLGTYAATATDAEDVTDPVACDPASGSLFPLGTTTVSCSATDSGGLTANGSFTVHVVDTTSPALGALPSPTASTTDPAGTTVSWTKPTADDLVDPSPSVDCLPASGSTFPIGTTNVTCTATDASGNGASGSFDVAVSLDDPLPPPRTRRRPRRRSASPGAHPSVTCGRWRASADRCRSRSTSAPTASAWVPTADRPHRRCALTTSVRAGLMPESPAPWRSARCDGRAAAGWLSSTPGA